MLSKQRKNCSAGSNPPHDKHILATRTHLSSQAQREAVDAASAGRVVPPVHFPAGLGLHLLKADVVRVGHGTGRSSVGRRCSRALAGSGVATAGGSPQVSKIHP